MYEAQMLFIEIGNSLLELADNQEESLREIFYEGLRLVMNRGELGLAYLGFDSSFDVLLQNNA